MPVSDPKPATDRPRRARTLTDLDRRLIAALRVDGRATNRALARELGVAQTTVAARIRRMNETGMMRVVAASDLGACGYDLMLMLGIRVSHGALTQVAEQLALIPEVTGAITVLGRFDLCATLVAENKQHLAKVLHDPIGSIEGVEDLELEFVLEVTKHSTELATMSRPQSAELPVLSPNLDELDRRIIAELRIDGRKSNREVARTLEVSEGTIRGRLRRLQDDRVIRSMVVTDPAALGVRCVAYVFLKVKHGSARPAADALSKMPELPFVSITLGRYEIVAMALVENRDILAKLVSERIASLPDVQRVETMESVSLVKHDYRWVRILKAPTP